MIYRIPLLFDPQPEGGYTVTCPLIPEFLTEGDTIEEANENVRDAFQCVLEIYQDEGRSLPQSIVISNPDEAVLSDSLVSA